MQPDQSDAAKQRHWGALSGFLQDVKQVAPGCVVMVHVSLLLDPEHAHTSCLVG